LKRARPNAVRAATIAQTVLGATLMLAHFLVSFGSAAQGGQKKNSPDLSHVSININQASAQDFEKLPGIGPELARRIVAYREKHGPFQRVEDLLVVRGIGPKKWRAIRPYLRVDQKASR
jgi:comEA protein